jgi:hypothetical protein
MSILNRLRANDPKLRKVHIDLRSFMSSEFTSALLRNTVVEELILDDTLCSNNNLSQLLFTWQAARRHAILTFLCCGGRPEIYYHFILNDLRSPNLQSCKVNLMLLSSDLFRTECLPVLTTFVNLEVLFVAVADDLFQVDTFIELCGILSRLPNLRTIDSLFGNFPMDKASMTAVVDMVSTSKTIQTMPARSLVIQHSSNPDFTQQWTDMTRYCHRNKVLNDITHQHSIVQMTTLLSDVTPLGLFPLVLAKLSRKGWLDILLHVVREKHGELVTCATPR